MAGDPDAFGELFGRHRDRLWAVALGTLRNPDDAADALQEAMISAFRRAAGFRGEAAVTTWLHRIVVNSCLDLLRRKSARPAARADEDAALDALGQPAVPLGDPASASDTALDVRAALHLLPAEQRAALVLVDMLGYPVKIAAQILGVRPGTVKSRCARGRARLLPHLAHLREAAQPPGREGNQAASPGVSSELVPAPAAAAGHDGTAVPGGGHDGTPASQRHAENGERSAHLDRPS